MLAYIGRLNRVEWLGLTNVLKADKVVLNLCKISFTFDFFLIYLKQATFPVKLLLFNQYYYIALF